MRVRLLVLVLMAVVIVSKFAYAEGYSQAEENDYGVYLYFSNLLKELDRTMEGVLSENGTELAGSFYNLTNTTATDAVRYSSLGIRPSVLELAYRFKALGRDTYELALSQQKFIESLENGNVPDARSYLFSMKAYLEEIRLNLAYVRDVRLVGENGEDLSFDLKGTYEILGKVAELIDHYEKTLDRMSAPTEFLIFSSKEKACLYENVTFYGYTLGLKNISVVIDNTSYTPKLLNGSFKLQHSFSRTGIHVVYAKALNGSDVLVSNVLHVYVQKIPTYVVAREEVGVNVTVKGNLIDEFGNPLPGKVIVLRISDENYTSHTDKNGTFVFELGNLLEAKNSTISFPGDDVYEKAVANLTLLPSKGRVNIRLFFDGGEVREGDVIKIAGYINGTREEIPLEVYVDGKLTDTIDARGNFTLPLKFKRGQHSVYVRFPGNEKFAESVSNVVEIKAVPYNYTQRALVFVAFLILGLLAYMLTTRRPEVVVTKTKLENDKTEVVEEKMEETDPIKAYRILYNLLRRLYHLPKSITPRELLKRFKNESFVPELKKATSIHEKAFYGRKGLSTKDVIEGIRSVAIAIVKVFVREEL